MEQFLNVGRLFRKEAKLSSSLVRNFHNGCMICIEFTYGISNFHFEWCGNNVCQNQIFEVNCVESFLKSDIRLCTHHIENERVFIKMLANS